MSKETSVAPTERVNIVYQPATGNAQEQVELPLKILMLGDFTGKPDDRPLEERAPINVDKDNFTDVMAQQNLQVTMSVPDRLSQEEGATLPVTLSFRSLADFTPESIVQQVPELEKMMRLRSALTALKGPLGNIPAFRRRLQDLLNDADSRQSLMRELGMKADEKSAPKQ
jgi:type VI secretion system protein ImpB